MIKRSFNYVLVLIGVIGFISFSTIKDTKSDRWVMWSKRPATLWEDAFVTGNGRHGTMVMGKAGTETITNVHEELFMPYIDRKGGDAKIAHLLPKVREMIRNGKSNEASILAVGEVHKQFKEQGITQKNHISPHPAFDLKLNFDAFTEAKDYRRELNLETGEAITYWSDVNHDVEQRVFSSQADNINVVELRAKGKSKLNLTLKLEQTAGGSGKKTKGLFNTVKASAESNWLYYHADYTKDKSGYDGVARVITDGGKTTTKKGTITVSNANSVLVLVRIQPLKNGAITEHNAIQSELESMPTKYDALLKPHVAKHSDMFNRVALDMGCANLWKTVPNEELLADMKVNGVSPHFLEKVHAMGRYLLISTSGKYPAPLQGIWGATWSPKWGGSFTTNSNVNLAISYFGVGNLPEVANGYYGYIERQLEGWRRNAKHYMGCRGILASLNMDPENGYVAHNTVNHPAFYWPGGTGWNIRPLYDYGLLSGDDTFMKEKVLPIYKELALFYEDYLLKGEDGIYDIIPSESPENDPKGKAKRGNRLTENSTMDVAVAKECFAVLLELGEKFNLPKKDIKKWQEFHDNLPAYRINEDGALAEWIPERYGDRYNHRHNSHLYPIYPGTELVGKDVDPKLQEAVKVALDKRYGFDTKSAHGLIHLALMGARIGEPEKVKLNLNRMATREYHYEGFVTSHDPYHEVYNLDAALSLPRLLTEMIVFSRQGYIRLLPGWPESYGDGELKGVLIRGGHKMDVSWANGKLKSATLYAGKKASYDIEYGNINKTLDLKAGKVYQLDSNLNLKN